MPNDATKIALGKPLSTGGAFTAVAATPLPTTVAGALNAAFKLGGYVSESGLVQHIGTSVTTIKEWGGSPVRKIQSDHDVTYDLELIETNEISQNIYYGDPNVTMTAATVSTGQKLDVIVNADELPTQPWVFELKDGLRTGRVVLPLAQVTSRGDVSYVSTDAVKYPITLTAYPNAAGVKAWIFWDDGVFAP